jgi:hypothetical protein
LENSINSLNKLSTQLIDVYLAPSEDHPKILKSETKLWTKSILLIHRNFCNAFDSDIIIGKKKGRIRCKSDRQEEIRKRETEIHNQLYKENKMESQNCNARRLNLVLRSSGVVGIVGEVVELGLLHGGGNGEWGWEYQWWVSPISKSICFSVLLVPSLRLEGNARKGQEKENGN